MASCDDQQAAVYSFYEEQSENPFLMSIQPKEEMKEEIPDLERLNLCGSSQVSEMSKNEEVGNSMSCFEEQGSSDQDEY